MIELKDILVKAKDRLILDVPELRFEKGKRYGIIGENGSGKTTLLRVLIGTVQPSQGAVELQAKNDNIGYLPQSPYAFSFSVRRNVSMALENSQFNGALAREILKKVGLENLADSRGNRLSGGERQRLGLARVLAVPKQVLLLDEPTSATDIPRKRIRGSVTAGWFEKTNGL